ncbi:MAG: ornithine cyclodeaminase family protein [Pseudomonadota bacterium]
MKTLIITRRDVEKILTPKLANRMVEKAFKAYGLGMVEMPPKSYLHFKKGDLRTMPAYVHGQGFDVAGVKSVNVHPENQQYRLPSVMALIVLTDPGTGFPLAVLDGTYLTSMRTGAAGALAAKLLSRKNAQVAGFVGNGVQARTQLACMMEVRRLKAVKVWEGGRNHGSAQRFCAWVEKSFGLECLISGDIDEITTLVDILVTTTPSRTPLVRRVSPGTHINAIGADAAGKQEIQTKIMRGAKLVIDDWSQASHSGEINVPLQKRSLSRKDIYGELGEIAVGKKRGRTSDDEITVFDSTGLAIQDITCAYAVYAALKDKKGVKSVSFF